VFSNKSAKWILCVAASVNLVNISTAHGQWDEGKRILGQIFGGVSGGLICNALAAPRNRTAWTAACAIGGTIIGGALADRMSENDRRRYVESLDDAYQTDRFGQPIEWRGDRYYGSCTPVRKAYHRVKKTECRVVRYEMYDEYSRSTLRDTYNRPVASREETHCRTSTGWESANQGDLEDGRPSEFRSDRPALTQTYLSRNYPTLVGDAADFMRDSEKENDIRRLARNLERNNRPLTRSQFQMIIRGFKRDDWRSWAGSELRPFVQ
jgi:surface antigen